MQTKVMASPTTLPIRLLELIGGVDGADVEKYGDYTKVIKGDVEAYLSPPRTCIILKFSCSDNKIRIFPNLSIASHHLASTLDDLD